MHIITFSSQSLSRCSYFIFAASCGTQLSSLASHAPQRKSHFFCSPKTWTKRYFTFQIQMRTFPRFRGQRREIRNNSGTKTNNSKPKRRKNWTELNWEFWCMNVEGPESKWLRQKETNIMETTNYIPFSLLFEWITATYTTVLIFPFRLLPLRFVGTGKKKAQAEGKTKAEQTRIQNSNELSVKKDERVLKSGQWEIFLNNELCVRNHMGGNKFCFLFFLLPSSYFSFFSSFLVSLDDGIMALCIRR